MLAVATAEDLAFRLSNTVQSFFSFFFTAFICVRCYLRLHFTVQTLQRVLSRHTLQVWHSLALCFSNLCALTHELKGKETLTWIGTQLYWHNLVVTIKEPSSVLNPIGIKCQWIHCWCNAEWLLSCWLALICREPAYLFMTHVHLI